MPEYEVDDDKNPFCVKWAKLSLDFSVSFCTAMSRHDNSHEAEKCQDKTKH